jgi:hypothetical protein
MKIKIPATTPARTPIKKMEPSRKGESEIAGKNLKDQKIIKTVSAATIDTEADKKIRNKFFK